MQSDIKKTELNAGEALTRAREFLGDKQKHNPYEIIALLKFSLARLNGLKNSVAWAYLIIKIEHGFLTFYEALELDKSSYLEAMLRLSEYTKTSAFRCYSMRESFGRTHLERLLEKLNGYRFRICLAIHATPIVTNTKIISTFEAVDLFAPKSQSSLTEDKYEEKKSKTSMLTTVYGLTGYTEGHFFETVFGDKYLSIPATGTLKEKRQIEFLKYLKKKAKNQPIEYYWVGLEDKSKIDIIKEFHKKCKMSDEVDSKITSKGTDLIAHFQLVDSGENKPQGESNKKNKVSWAGWLCSLFCFCDKRNSEAMPLLNDDLFGPSVK